MALPDLNDPRTSLDTFARVRAAADGTDRVIAFSGDVHAWVPGSPAVRTFGFSGFNVARTVQVDGGWDLLSKEAVFYLDPDSGEVLRTWDNPWTGRTEPVVHVWNDPVNFSFRYESERGPWRLPWTEVGDHVAFTSDVFLAYPSPLPRAQFPRHSQSDLYEAAELFQYFARADDLAGDAPSVSALVSWTRIAPWVPFMGMGDTPGHLVYHCQGNTVDGGFDQLPSWLREQVLDDGRGFETAPRSMEGRNSTSWSYFRGLVERGELAIEQEVPA